MNKIFLDDQSELRSGWRAAVFLFAFFVISFFLIVISIGVITLLPVGESASGQLPVIIPFAISTIVAIVLGWLCGRFFENLPYKSLGASFTTGWLVHLASGLAVGAVTFLFAIIVVVASGSMSFALNATSAANAVATTLLTTLIIFTVAAASEEALFRGYLLQTFARSDLKWFGVAMTAVLFAFAHNQNPGANPLALANTLLAGVWFALAYFKTRDLWFPFGIHLAWNWLQGPVFGISVSGITGFAPDPLLRANDVGPAWLTGAGYGIEGGVACSIALILSLALIHYLPGFRANANLTADNTETAD
ncbi:MAG: lysostaphin resistance A-like protein [Pyrinomonadaceae bacterium]